VVDVTLKAPMGAAAAGQVAANRRKFRGTLEKAGGRLAAAWSDEPGAAAGPEAVKKKEPAPCRSWVSRWTS
jgi:ribosome maturation factor RimP